MRSLIFTTWTGRATRLVFGLAFVGAAACSRAAPAPVDHGPTTTASSAPDAARVPDTALELVPGLHAALARFTREADATPRGVLHLPPAADPERDRILQGLYGGRCRLERTCGRLWGLDCEAAVDGPYLYLNPRANRLDVIATCGGACMSGRCTNCPPKNEGWTCPVY